MTTPDDRRLAAGRRVLAAATALGVVALVAGCGGGDRKGQGSDRNNPRPSANQSGAGTETGPNARGGGQGDRGQRGAGQGGGGQGDAGQGGGGQGNPRPGG